MAAVIVRMYRDFLGDCFLLALPSSTGVGTAWVLIDCGAFQGDRLRAVAEDIRETTGGHLDLLIVTHEHWDHLSGFAQARDTFDNISIDEIWFGWTEKLGDPMADALRDKRGNAAKTLLHLQYHLRQALGPIAAPPNDDDMDDADPQSRTEYQSVLTLMGFLGADAQDGGLGAATGSRTAPILDRLRTRTGTKVEYLRPGGQPRALPGVAGVRAFVLGPPLDTTLLKRSAPTRKGDEVYRLASAAEDQGSYLIAALRLDKELDPNSELTDDELADFEMSRPFASQHVRKWKMVEKGDPKSVPAESYAIEQLQTRYFNPSDEWRSITLDWLGAAGGLALKLDEDTNNTSLALAFEITATGQVLLFPGDAQVGNWLSWHRCEWSDTTAADARKTSAADLLSRTVLYKVGHHGSHNATLRDQGLELMTSPDLVAMLPVQEDFARSTKHWNMPFPKLLTRLDERTRGRVLRADRSAAAVIDQLRGTGRTEEADQLAQRTVDGLNDLYVEYSITLPNP